MEVCGAIFIASCGSVPSANPPSPLRDPLPPCKRWGARKYIGARPPSLEQEWASRRSGGEIIFLDHHPKTVSPIAYHAQ